MLEQILRWTFPVVGLIAASLFWLNSHYRKQLYSSQSTTKLRDAVEGYAEISGTACDPVEPLSDPIKNRSCAWFRVETYEYERVDGYTRKQPGERWSSLSENEKKFGGYRWRRIDGVESNRPFKVTDGTGECLVEPGGAEIRGSKETVYARGPNFILRPQFRHTIWRISQGDPIYALGRMHAREIDGKKKWVLRIPSPAEKREFIIANRSESSLAFGHTVRQAIALVAAIYCVVSIGRLIANVDWRSIDRLKASITTPAAASSKNRSQPVTLPPPKPARKFASEKEHIAVWLEELLESERHGPLGTTPPMIEIKTRSRQVTVRNLSTTDLRVSLARVGKIGGVETVCMLEPADRYIPKSFADTYMHPESCKLSITEPLEFRIGELLSPSSDRIVVWWSDSAIQRELKKLESGR